MDAHLELDRERATLVRADTDLRQGEERVRVQEGLLSDLRSKGLDAREAERLLMLLRETLHQWREHRILILDRIAYLEAKLALPASTREPPR